MKSDIVENYFLSAKEFIKVAQEAEPAKLTKKPSETEWSGLYIIHHLADFEIHFSHRIIRILTENNPLIESYDESGYANVLNYKDREILESLNSILANRKLIYEILSKVDESVLERPAVHSVKGEIKLKNLLQSATGHLNDHMDQLRAAINS